MTKTMRTSRSALSVAVAMPAAISIAASAALMACGGGGESITATIMKPLPIAAPFVQADGLTVYSLFPAPGASVAAQDALAAAGIAVTSKKCAAQSFAGQGTVGGTPTYVVVFEVAASDLDQARAMDYQPVTAALQTSLGELFECCSKSL